MNLPPLIVIPRAADDLTAAAEQLESARTGYGGLFLDDARELFERIRRHPRMYRCFHLDYRRAVLQRFGYAVAYRITTDHVEVLAVKHCRRNPSHVLARTKQSNH